MRIQKIKFKKKIRKESEEQFDEIYIDSNCIFHSRELMKNNDEDDDEEDDDDDDDEDEDEEDDDEDMTPARSCKNRVVSPSPLRLKVDIKHTRDGHVCIVPILLATWPSM